MNETAVDQRPRLRSESCTDRAPPSATDLRDGESRQRERRSTDNRSAAHCAPARCPCNTTTPGHSPGAPRDRVGTRNDSRLRPRAIHLYLLPQVPASARLLEEG